MNRWMTKMRTMGAGVIAAVLAACSGTNPQALREGDMAPGFSLAADDGSTIRLADFRDRSPVVLYFYPKDQTPGCTKQACGFRDAMADYRARGVTVLGVSVDSVESHAEFKRRESLNFPLLADVSKEVSRSYGVLNNLGFSSRVTFLIGKDGRIIRIFRDFDAAANAREVLAALEASTPA